VLGVSFLRLVFHAPTSDDVTKHTKTMLLFGGAAMKNTQVNAGGLVRSPVLLMMIARATRCGLKKTSLWAAVRIAANFPCTLSPTNPAEPRKRFKIYQGAFT